MCLLSWDIGSASRRKESRTLPSFYPTAWEHHCKEVIKNTKYNDQQFIIYSGGASAAKEPGHFEVRKSSSQITWMHFIPQNS